MADIYLKRTLTGFVPADEASQEATKLYKVGEVYRAKVVKPRSYTHHKLCMALLNLTFDNQDRYDNFNSLRYSIAVDAGHFEELVAPSGEVFKMPKSISYDALDEVEFTKVMGAMMTVCANLLGNMSLHELEGQISIYADNHYGRAQ